MTNHYAAIIGDLPAKPILVGHSLGGMIGEEPLRQDLAAYRHSHALNDLIEFPGRGRSLTIDHGRRDIADACLDWLDKRGL